MASLTRTLATLLWLICLLPSGGTLFQLTDEPADSRLVNHLLQPGDTVWLAPAEFQDWLLITAPNAAAPYYFIYPWLLDDPRLAADLQARLESAPPVLIVYHRDLPVAGITAWTLPQFAPSLTAWVDAHYRPLPGHPDVYVRHDRYEALAARLVLE